MTIRVKLLALIAGILLVSMSVYLLLALRLMRDDKLTYAFDLNQTVAHTLSSQVGATLQRMESELTFFGESAIIASGRTREEMARRFLRSDPDLVRLTFYLPQRSGVMKPATQIVAVDRLAHIELNAADLDQIDRSTAIPLERALAEGLVVVNRSVPPASQLFTAVVAAHAPDHSPAWAVVADATQDRLLDIFNATPLYAATLVDVYGNVLTHPDVAKVVSRANLLDHPVVASALSAAPGTSGGASEFVTADGRRMLGAYAPVGTSRLWVISEIERAKALEALNKLMRLSVLFGVAIVLAAFSVSILFARRLTEPIRRLSAATARLASGRYDVNPAVSSGDEIGELADDFREMAAQVRDAQVKLIQNERMAALGLVGAGITHDVKNPLTGILGFAELALLSLDNKEEVQDCLNNIHQAALKCNDIIRDFLSYARQGGERQPAELNAVVGAGLRMILYQLRSTKVKLHEQYGTPPPVRVNVGKIQQVIMNLAVNAQQAINRGGNITVTTRALSDGRAEVEVKDDGPGIPADILQRIFEPFFTTKEPGKGTGLGLAVSRSIVEEHGGELVAESTFGEGAVFRVRLPADPEATSPAALGASAETNQGEPN